MFFNQADEITKLILNSALDAVVCADTDGKIFFWSPQAEIIFGWKENEVIGKRLSETIVPQELRREHEEGIRNYRLTGHAVRSNKLVETKASNREGKTFPVELTIVPVKNDRGEFFCAFIRDISARKAAEQDLRREKELADFVFDNLPGIFYLQDADGHYLRWNKNLERASGYSAKEITAMHPLDFFEGADRNRVDAAIRKVFRDGRAEVSADVITKHKTSLPFYLKGERIVYQDRPCLIGTGVDLSQQQRAIEDVKKSEQKYRSLFEQASDPIMVTDFSGHFIDVNESLCRLFGYSREQLKSMNITQLIDAADLKENPMNFERLAAGAHVFSKRRMLRSDGSIVHVEANVKKVSDTRVLAIARDTTARIKVENELAESELRLRTIFEADPDCIKLMDKDCKLIGMNPAGLAIIEAEGIQQVLGQSVLPLVDEEYRSVFQEINLAVFTGESRTLEFGITSLKGTRRWMEMNAVPLRNKDGGVVCSLSLARDITERRNAAEAIRQSEERYRALVENATEALVVFDVEKGKFESVSESAIDFFKMTKGELLQIGPLEISPEFQPGGILSAVMVKEKIDEAIRGGKPSFEWTHIDKPGNLIPCEVWLVRLPSDHQVLVRGSIFNISERKKTEEAIRISEQKYKLLFNKNPVPMIMLSKSDLCFIDVNDAALAQYGYRREEFLQMTAFDIHSKEDIPAFRKAMEQRTEGINDFGIRNHRKSDGTLIKVEIRAHHILNEGKPVWLALANDVTERMIAEDKLKASEYQFRKVTENEILGVAWATPDGRLSLANNTFCRMIGYEPNELKGMHFSEFTHPDDTLMEMAFVKEIIEGKRAYYQVEKRYKTRNGNFLWVELSLSAYRNRDNNSIEFFIGIVQNIHERKMAEEEIRRSHDELRQLSSYLETIREEERTSIAREIHDELGQQLTGLKMDISWLNKKIPEENKPIHQKISGMLSLVDDTVKTVRRISTELRPGILDDLGLVDALQWQSNEFEKRTGISCAFNTTFTDSTFGKKLSTGVFRVFQETLTNVVRHAQASEIITSLEKQDESLVLRVRDNGNGFEESEIKKKKTLGLIGMKERAKMFGGNLTVQSAAGKGTLITLQVPLHVASGETDLLK